MSENLALPLSLDVPVEANSNGTTFLYTPTATAMNGNTKSDPAYGWYYNWMAATAETVDTPISGTDYDGSICPKGWRIPSWANADSFSWAHLANSYGIIQSGASTPHGLFDTPVSLVKSGSSGGYGGQRFYAWASTYYYNSIAYAFLAFDNYVYFNNWWDYVTVGFSIRCVASH